MKNGRSRVQRLLRWVLPATAVAAVTLLGASPALAAGSGPVRIGVIAFKEHPLGIGILQAAELAASEINADGGIDGRQIKLYQYDDHASSTDAVRAFQRAVKQDHVVAVVGGFISELDLALMPWASRYKVPYIGGGASDKIAEMIHKDYKRYKYVFEQTPNSYYLARTVCDMSHDVLVKQLGFKTAAIMSEDAAWTKPLDAEYLKCLPKAGLKVVGHFRFDPSTTDFTPLYNKIEATHADVIIAGMAHTGLRPTVQWHNQQVPALLAGINLQGGATDFWSKTNGGTQGMITWNTGAPGAAVTPRSIPFQKAYHKRFGGTPTLEAYMTYDSIYALKHAIEQAHSTNAEALVKALEKVNFVGAMGRFQFYGRHARFTHDVKYGRHLVSGVGFQWQDGKQVAIWPAQAANGKVILPSFVKAAQH
ncbi:MAG TPA: ABC transporter substrate-binding protein [Gammaproteobacteria bacterium]|nr:ABC transporter substrate-binding protein [Gammaproteobacteria bacterium]